MSEAKFQCDDHWWYSNVHTCQYCFPPKAKEVYEAAAAISEKKFECDPRLHTGSLSCPLCGWKADYATMVAHVNATDSVNHPPHYKAHPSGVECIEITRHMSFNLGSAMKYLWRNEHKGAQIEDLKKAVWYIEDEIERLSK